MRTHRPQCLLAFCLLTAIIPGAQQANIHDAARAGELAAVQALIAKDRALVGARDQTGRTPLHVASAAGRVEVAAYLLSGTADVNAADNTGATPLHLAAGAGQDEVARLLIEHKATVDARDAGGYTPLARAAVRGAVPVATRLLASGAAVEAANSYNRTPLLLVARESGNVELARLLLDRKADINARDKFGDTPLTLAAWRGYRPLVDLLLERGAAFPASGPGRTRLLRQAVEQGLEALFAKLLEAGVSAPPGGPGTRSLLHEAASSGSVPIIERLLASKPDVNQQDENGWTPLHDAAFMGRLDAVKLLLGAGANQDVRNALGQSPWNLATEHKRSAAADLLAARGADRGAPQFPVLTGDYLGQKPPGRVPVPFAPAIAGGHFDLHSSVVFSPDGREAYWSELVPRPEPGYGIGRTMVSRRIGERWTYPQVAVVGSVPLDDVPLVSADGARIYDMSGRPLPGGVAVGKENIWVADRVSSGWGEPRPLDPLVNAPPHHWQFAVDRNGGVYFSSNWKGVNGLFFSRLIDGRYAEPAPVGAPINTAGGEAMPFIARDASYLLFSRNYDIWVSFRGSDGAWMEPVALPASVNTPTIEICPVVSPDGRYLFFLRGKAFWVDAAVIEELRPKTAHSPSAQDRSAIDVMRDRDLQPDRVMDAISLRPGMTVGEAGASYGYFTFKMSRRVGTTGTVYANDIDPAALRLIDDRCGSEGITNIRTVVGAVDDPLYPRRDLDLVVVFDCLFEFSEPVKWMQNARKYLKPDGRLVIVDPDRAKMGSFPHALSRAQIREFARQSGYVWRDVDDSFLKTHMIVVLQPVPAK